MRAAQAQAELLTSTELALGYQDEIANVKFGRCGLRVLLASPGGGAMRGGSILSLPVYSIDSIAQPFNIEQLLGADLRERECLIGQHKNQGLQRRVRWSAGKGSDGG
jgi:hypothetical protein